MDFKCLNYFIRSAETLNFTKAAKICGVSQTAISLAIVKMEEDLGFKLFDRNNRSMRLTPAGRDFYEWARKTMHGYEKTVEAGKNIASGYTGIIKIGSSSCFDALWFISQLQPFRKTFANVHIEQRIMEPPSLLVALHNKDIDAVVSPPCQYMGCSDIAMQDIACFHMVLIVGKNHPLAKYDTVPKELLRQQDCIILTYQGMPRAEAFFNRSRSKSGINFKSIRQMNHLEEILLALIDSDSVAFLPAFISDYLNSFSVALPITDCDMNMLFSFCYLKTNKNPTLGALNLALQRSYAING